jgi:hypothetical protein
MACSPIKKAVGNLGAAHGLSPLLGAGQWTDSFFHHQHHHAFETTTLPITLLNLRWSYIAKELKVVK